MLKSRIAIVIAGVVALCARGQSQLNVSVGIGTGVPSPNWLTSSQNIEAGIHYFFSDQFSLGITLGYENLYGFRSDFTTNLVPLTLQAKYYLSNGALRPYALTQVGVARQRFHYTQSYRDPTSFDMWKIAGSVKQFVSDLTPVYGLGVGVLIPWTESLSLDFGAQINVIVKGLQYDTVLDGTELSSWRHSELHAGLQMAF